LDENIKQTTERFDVIFIILFVKKLSVWLAQDAGQGSDTEHAT